MATPDRKGTPPIGQIERSVDHTETLIDREYDAWCEFKGNLDILKTHMSWVKTEGVKENFEKVWSAFITFGEARRALHEEWRFAARSAGHAELEAKVADKMKALEMSVLGALTEVQEKLAVQERTLVNLAAPLVPTAGSDAGWMEVVKRSRGGPQKPQKKLEPAISENAEKKLARQRKTPRSRPPAIVVSKNDEHFSELLRTVRHGIDPQVTGNSINKMRRTQKGDLLIEVNGGAESVEKVRVEVARSLGDGAKIYKLENMSSIEIRNLDEETTKDEVLNAVTNTNENSFARFVSIKKTYGSSQIAVVMLPSVEAKRLCTAGRLRVGLISARVRPTKLRCYRCLTFGHKARECTGVDRSACCRRCGGAGHFSRDCTATPDVAVAFKAVLSGSAKQVATVVENITEEKSTVKYD